MAMYEHDAGTGDETVTVPSGRAIKKYSAIAGGSGGTITITPKGGSAQPAITVPADRSWQDDFTTDAPDLDANVALPEGSTIAFAGMVSWMVRYT